jgi:DNA ligase-4
MKTMSTRSEQTFFRDKSTRLTKANSFADLSKKISQNGGNVVNLDNPKLTHIVIDKRDDSRRLELMKRTSK